MIDKNGYYEVEFTDLTHDAMGVCKIDGYPVFVKDALKGERALIKIIKLNKNFGFGRLIDIKDESPFRKIPICEHYQVCGGCNMMHMNYQTQLDFKRYRTQDTLKKLGQIDTVVKETVGMNNPYYYRNKVIIPFGYKNGKIIAGLYKQRSHDIVNIKRCHIFPKIISDMIRFIKSLFTELEMSVYDETTDEGLIRALMFRYSHTKEDVSVTIITRLPKLPHKDKIIEDLTNQYPTIVSVVHNVNTEKTNVVLGTKSRVLFGNDMIEDSLLGLNYEISHRSFYQINPMQTELVYKKAIEYARLRLTDTVVDAYCGIGTIGLSVANQVKEVIGMDTVKDSIKNAINNAKNNQIKNAKFVVGAAEEILPSMREKSVDVLFVDPPRKGCDKKFLEAIVKLKVRRVVYISCNVSTLARDLNFLQANHYQIKEVTPFDMFPQTSHIESVTLLELR